MIHFFNYDSNVWTTMFYVPPFFYGSICFVVNQISSLGKNISSLGNNNQSLGEKISSLNLSMVLPTTSKSKNLDFDKTISSLGKQISSLGEKISSLNLSMVLPPNSKSTCTTIIARFNGHCWQTRVIHTNPHRVIQFSHNFPAIPEQSQARTRFPLKTLSARFVRFEFG